MMGYEGQEEMRRTDIPEKRDILFRGYVGQENRDWPVDDKGCRQKEYDVIY